MRDSSITATVDYDAPGIQHGHLRLPYSRNDSAWGSVMIPIAVIQNGTGPTALITGGNHGDEYEGPLAILDLAAHIERSEVNGRIILVPFMNQPAVAGGTRTSPIDAGNMNRAFPGDPQGSVTEKIADYFQCILLPMADYVLDFHSGGKTLDFLPFAAHHAQDDKSHEARCKAARDAFNAPYCLKMLEIDSTNLYDTAAEKMGKTFVTTELGGAGTATPVTVGIAKKGLRNFLVHAGILDGQLIIDPTSHLRQSDPRCFHFSPENGMIEFTRQLGEFVKKGDVIAHIWPMTCTGKAPLDVRAALHGLLAVRHVPGLIKQGDCLAVLAQHVPENTQVD